MLFRTLSTILLLLSAPYTIACGEGADYNTARGRMVEEQIVSRGIKDTRVLDAMRKVERHLFIPQAFWSFAYDDRPLPIGNEQTISQPFIVAYMVDLLDLKESDRVLEIGTGSGYQTAILAEIVNNVFTIEIVKPLAVESKARLSGMGYRNIKFKQGDGREGWYERTPFNKIIVSAAAADIPVELVNQLYVGGMMVIPIGVDSQNLYLVTKTKDSYKKVKLMQVSFVPMVKE